MERTMNGARPGRILAAGGRRAMVRLLLVCALVALAICVCGSSLTATAVAKSGSWPIAPPSPDTTVFTVSLAGQDYGYTWADVTGEGTLGGEVEHEYTLEKTKWRGVWLRTVLADVERRSGVTLDDDWRLRVVAVDGWMSGMMFVGDVKDPDNNYMLAQDPVQGTSIENPTEDDWNEREEHPELWYEPTYVRICTNGDYGNTAYTRLVKTTGSMTILTPATASLRLTSPTVSQTKACRARGTKLALRATATRAPGAISAEPIVWRSSNAKVARVAASGTVTARKVGKAVITAKSGACTRRFTVVVLARHRPATKITLPRTRAMKVGATARAGARLYPAGATVTVTWRSSKAAVVKVDRAGTLKSVKRGKATITVRTSDGKTARCVVTVKR